MTSALPTSVTQRTAASARAYVTSSGSLVVAIGAVPVGTCVVVATFAGRMGTNNLLGLPVANISGAFRSGIGMTSVHADAPNPQYLGFNVSYGFVQAAAADNSGLTLTIPYTVGAGEHMVIDAIAIAYDGSDPNGPVTSGHLEDNAFSTPSITPAADSVLLHIYCAQNFGILNAGSDLPAAGFGTFEEDDNIPLLVYAASVIEDWAGGRPSLPRAISPYVFGSYGQQPPQYPGQHLRAAVIAIPIRRGDSAGDIVT